MPFFLNPERCNSVLPKRTCSSGLDRKGHVHINDVSNKGRDKRRLVDPRYIIKIFNNRFGKTAVF